MHNPIEYDHCCSNEEKSFIWRSVFLKNSFIYYYKDRNVTSPAGMAMWGVFILSWRRVYEKKISESTVSHDGSMRTDS